MEKLADKIEAQGGTISTSELSSRAEYERLRRANKRGDVVKLRHGVYAEPTAMPATEPISPPSDEPCLPPAISPAIEPKVPPTIAPMLVPNPMVPQDDSTIVAVAKVSITFFIFFLDLRRDRDSNPGYGYPYAAFRVRSVRPLRHLSIRNNNAKVVLLLHISVQI